ncbi:MAG: DUF393 domain-containing protein [Bacteriovoracaceae bacterium]|nr:DUF393 domain-containing protein [Bacteriovoracaceae bacterium]
MELKLPLLVYDAQCPLCVRFKQGLERWDTTNRICYVPLENPDVFIKYPQLSFEACREKVHYLKEDGEILIGADVVSELIRHYPGVGKLAWLLETDVGKKTVEFFYQKVESVRQKIKSDEEKCGTCR